jgi:hypothetical protein
MKHETYCNMQWPASDSTRGNCLLVFGATGGSCSATYLVRKQKMAVQASSDHETHASYSRHIRDLEVGFVWSVAR